MEKVRCPYCGAEMEMRGLTITRGSGGYYSEAWQGQCPKCWAKSPYASGMGKDGGRKAAHAAAMRRWQEPNRVLTLDEVLAIDPDGATCVEERKTGEIEVILNSDILQEFAEVMREGGHELAKKAYGRFSRAWLRRPTDKERMAAKWEDEG